MKLLKRSAGTEGFTLIEVMIAMCFLTFIVQAMAMVSLHAQSSSTYARRLTSANIIAEQALESYRNTEYENLTDEDADVRCFDGHMTPTGCGAGAIFTRTTQVTVDTPIAAVTKVDVNVTWTGFIKMTDEAEEENKAPEEHQARLVSYLSEY
jgi:Tfp pilus assembly protein PilV